MTSTTNDPNYDSDPMMSSPPGVTSSQATSVQATFAPSVVDPGSGGGYYTNTSAEVAYAKQYAGTPDATSSAGYNSAYWHFKNDCTNFVSQALRAGGWSDVRPAYSYNATDSSQWFWINGVAKPFSYSWDAVFWFVRFVQKSGRGVWYTNWKSYARPGDIVVADWESDGTPDHLMIVTATALPTQIYYTQHTRNRLNRPWTLARDENRGATWRFFHPF